MIPPPQDEHPDEDANIFISPGQGFMPSPSCSEIGTVKSVPGLQKSMLLHIICGFNCFAYGYPGENQSGGIGFSPLLCAQ